MTGGGASSQPQVLRVYGCPDADCNGTFTIQPHKVVNGYARYLKNHSFYYLYKTTTGHWMITWFEVKSAAAASLTVRPPASMLSGAPLRTSLCRERPTSPARLVLLVCVP